MASLLTAIIEFFKESLQGNQAAGDPPPPGKLGDIPATLNKLTQIQLATNNNGLGDWLDELDRVLNDVALRDTIIVRALQLRAPRLAEALTFAGLIEFEFRDGNPRAFAFRLAWNRLDSFLRTPGDTTLVAVLQRIQDLDDLKIAQVLFGHLLFSPGKLLELEYAQLGFEALPNPVADGAVDLIQLVQDLINSPLKFGVPLKPPLDADTFKNKAIEGRELLTDYLAILGPDAIGVTHRLDGFGVELKLSNVQSFVAGTLDLGGGLRLVASATDTGPQTYRLVISGGTFDPAQASSGDFETSLKWTPTGGLTVIGPADGTRLEIGSARFSLRFQKPQPPTTSLFSFRGVIESVALVLSTKQLGLLARVASLPDNVRLQTDISFAYLQGVGLQVQAGGAGSPPLALEFTVPLNVSAGPGDASVKLERAVVRLEAKLDGETLRARTMVRLGARGQFGPVRVLADGMGAWFGHWDGEVAGVLPPTALGISLEAGPVSGGGFLASLPGEQFAGGFEAKVLGIGVAAFALFGSADGAPAFVAILGIRLPPPGVQIGFGFAISGVGGLVGINRRADTDVLREQLASGASGQILFCDDPLKNGLTVIGQLPRMFPAARGVFLVGPTFQISWLELLRVDVGVFIELPGPRQIFIAGSAKLIVGSEQLALIYFRMDFIGGIDLTKSLIYFDAVLINSHFMHVFTITGSMALRIAYGPNGYFLFSVGGFHPSFNPGGLELPKLVRAGTSMSIDVAWLKLETYVALTSNTFQLGASIEAGLELGPIGAHGWFRFDAIVQYSPFYFTAAVDAGFDIEVLGESLYGVRVSGTLSGPGPLVLHAKASVKILFVRISGNVTVRLGSSSGDQVPAITNVLAPLQAELRKPANLRCEGDDPNVILQPPREVAIGGTPVLGAVGTLIWEQKRVPFGVDLQRFEGALLDRVHHITLTSDAEATPETDWFGVGSYLTLSESEALNNARFMQAQSGARVSLTKMIDGIDKPCNVELDLVKLPKRIKFATDIFAVNYMTTALNWVHEERTGSARVKPGEPRVTTKQESWNAHDASGAFIAQDVSSTQAFAAARGKGLAQPATATPINLQGVF